MRSIYFVAATLLAGPAAAVVKLIPNPAALGTNVPAGCRALLSTQITACSDFLDTGNLLDPSTQQDFDDICSKPCQDALTKLQTDAKTRCGDKSFQLVLSSGFNFTVKPLNLAGKPLYKRNLLCLKDAKTSKYCGLVLNAMTKPDQCADCNLQITAAHLNNMYDYSSEDPDTFKSVKASCNVAPTAYPVTYTPGGTATTPAPPATTCGSKYVTVNGDTIASLSKSRRVASDSIISHNNLQISADKLDAGINLCFDGIPTCVVQQVAQNDTCAKLVSSIGGGVTDVMLRSWNPTIHKQCDNLDSMVGKYICISPPGSDTKISISTMPDAQVTPNITSANSGVVWETLGPGATVTNPPNITTSWLFNTEFPPIPTSTQIVDKNAQLDLIKRLANCPFFQGGPTQDPDGIATPPDYPGGYNGTCYTSWQPYCDPTALTGPIPPSPTNIPKSCYPTTTVKPTTTEKAGPPGPTPPSALKNCDDWRLVHDGDSCEDIAKSGNITMSEFLSMNPTLNSQCTNLGAGVAYCVHLLRDTPASPVTQAPPSGAPTSDGTNKACKRWYVERQGDTCQAIADKFKIPLQRLRQLNRSLNAACDNLVVGNAYCVNA